MEDKTLRKVQLLQKYILDEVVRICDNNNIKYFLIGGTLLGAVRHKGFIPWDDDLDIAMLREDFQKFIFLAQKELSNDFMLQDWFTDKGYGMGFAKILLKGTKYYEKEGTKKKIDGIFIDIMPFDYISSDIKKQEKHNKKLYILKKILLCKCGYNSGKTCCKKFLYKVLNIYSIFFKKEKLKSSIMYHIESLGKDDKNFVGNLVFPSNTRNSIPYKYPKNWFDDVVKVEFEGSHYDCPKEYVKFLEYNYGDYMTPPPENERYNMHNIVKLDFGKFKE